MKKIIVSGGCGQIGSRVAEILLERGDEVLVIENFATGRREQWNRDWQHPAHLNLAGARELAAELQGAQTWLTHLTHYMGLHAETNKLLSDGVQLAHDGLVLEVE